MLIRQAAQRSMPASQSRSNGGPDEVSPEFPERQTTPGPDDVYDSGTCGRGQSSGGGAYYYDSGCGGGDSYSGSVFMG